LIIDQNLFANGCLKTIENAFKDSELSFCVCPVNEGDTGIATLKNLTGQYVENGCDSIITAGNKDLVKMSKILNIAVSGKPADIMNFKGSDMIPGPLNPLFSIIVNMDCMDTLIREVNFEKRNYCSDFLVPDIIFIDPEILQYPDMDTLAGTVLEALSISMEAYLSDSDPFIRSYAGKAVNIIMDDLIILMEMISKKRPYFYSVIRKKRIEERWFALYNAICMSGIVASNRLSSPVRTLGKLLSGICNQSDGVLMGILLPNVLEHFAIQNKTFNKQSLLPLTGTELYCRTPEYQRRDHVFYLIRNVINELSIITSTPVTLKNAGIVMENLESVIETLQANDVFVMSEDDCRNILNHAYWGSPLNSHSDMITHKGE